MKCPETIFGCLCQWVMKRNWIATNLFKFCHCVVPDISLSPPYPSPTKVIWCAPSHPIGNSILVQYFSFKNFAFSTPTAVGMSMTFCGGSTCMCLGNNCHKIIPGGLIITGTWPLHSTWTIHVTEKVPPHNLKKPISKYPMIVAL